MSTVIKTNKSAVSAVNVMNENARRAEKGLAKVASGERITGAGGDSSGYAISERMRVLIRALDRDSRNAQDGAAMLKVADGAVNATVEILAKLKERVINAASDSNTDNDRMSIQKELDRALDEIDDNASVSYNQQILLNGAKSYKGEETHTSLTNGSLSTDTAAATKLTDLKSRAGESLLINKTDTVTVSYVVRGETFSGSFQVEDNSLQDLFNFAEDIDKSDKLFASRDVKSVAAALGSEKAVSGESAAVDKAVNALRETLGHANLSSTAKLKFAGDTGGSGGISLTPGGSIAIGGGISSSTISGGAGAGGAIFDLVADGAASPLSSGVSNVDGEDFLNLKKAANDAQNSYDFMTAQGIALYTALKNEHKSMTWTHQNGSNAAELKTAPMQNLINQSSETTRELYDKYMETVSSFEANKTNAENLLKEYNEKMSHLGALEREQVYYNARDAYESDADIFVKNLVRTVSASDDVGFSYVDKDGATRISAAFDKGRSAFIQAMEADLTSRLQNIDPGKNNVSAAGVIDGIKIESGGNYDTIDNTAGYATLKAAAQSVKDAATALDAAAVNMNDQSVAEPLLSAHEKTLPKYAGPQLIIGKTVGTGSMGQLIETANRESAITVTAAKGGIEGQIAGFTISVKDASGKAKKNAQTSLNDFNESIRAQNASTDKSFNLHIGSKANMTMSVGFTDMRAEALGLRGTGGATINVSNPTNANAALAVIDSALKKAVDQATAIGSMQSRLSYAVSNLTISGENVTASESTLRDADMAKEMTDYTKNNILTQSAQSALSQSNQSSSAVLSLLQ